MDTGILVPKPAGAAALPSSLNYIIEELKKHRRLKPAEIRRIILEAKVQPEDLAPWADFNHPVADSYGRKLVYDGGNFEVMVMSWQPGDFSTIHDHGSTQWGAVQIFGPAEHATFRVEDDSLSTLARWQVEPGEVVGVSHSLVHQMGNPTSDQRFLSLHVYGLAENIDSVTGDARVFDLENNTIQRVDGGVFFALPPDEVKRLEAAPAPDWPTRLRHMVELVKRLRKMETAGQPCEHKNLEKAIEDTFSLQQLGQLRHHVQKIVDHGGLESKAWRLLKLEIGKAAKLQARLQGGEALPDACLDFTKIKAVMESGDLEKIKSFFDIKADSKAAFDPATDN